MNLSSKELAGFPQGKLNELENPNKRAMYGAMGINIGNVQEAQGIKSILQSVVAGQGAQQATPGGSIVDRMAMAVKAKVDQQNQQEAMQQQQAEMMKAAMGFRGMESAENGVGSLPVSGENYVEGGIVPFAKGGQPEVAAKEESWEEAAIRRGEKKAADYMAAYPKPERIDREAIFKDAFNTNQEMGKPYVDKMNSLIEKMRPDAEGTRGQNRSNSIIQAGLAMMQARGGPGLAGGLAGIAGGAQRGLNQYQEGEQSLQNQLQKHQAFEMEGIKNELGMRKDDLRYAQGMAEEARKEYGLDSREHTKALAQAGQIQEEVMRLAAEAEKIRRKAITDERTADLKHQQIVAAIGRNNSGGGGRSTSDRQDARNDRQDARFDAAIQAALRDKAILAPFIAQYKGQPDAYFKGLNDYARYVEISIGGKSAAPPSTAPAAAPSNQRVIPYKP